jgi:hypothetical protein
MKFLEQFISRTLLKLRICFVMTRRPLSRSILTIPILVRPIPQKTCTSPNSVKSCILIHQELHPGLGSYNSTGEETIVLECSRCLDMAGGCDHISNSDVGKLIFLRG